MKITQTKHGVLIEVFVKPNSHKFNIIADNDEITIYSTQEPVEGKVNKEIIKELSRIFHAKVEIISGSTSRQKRLLIADSEKADIEQIIASKRTQV
jgi:hypothetical protein